MPRLRPGLFLRPRARPRRCSYVGAAVALAGIVATKRTGTSPTGRASSTLKVPRILLVEDEAIIALELLTILSKTGALVVVSTHAVARRG